jgi:hypothetical protein
LIVNQGTVSLWRRRETGIRMAPGAPPARMLASIVLHQRMNIEGEGGWHVPGILPAAAIFIVTIGLLSAAGPARRAIRVDPTEALRDG